jgi:hypothetical protein
VKEVKHYSVTVKCKWCSHRFTVCVHTRKALLPNGEYTVLCPMNQSKVIVSSDELVSVQTCPPDAIVVRAEQH